MPTQPKVVVIDDNTGSGVHLTHMFRANNCDAEFCEANGVSGEISIDGAVKMIRSLKQDLIVCDNNLTDDCLQEGLAIAERFRDCHFILTSGQPKDPQALAAAANAVSAYFIDRTAGADYIVAKGKQLMAEGRLDQEELMHFPRRS